MQIYIDTTLRSRKQNFLDRSEPDFAEIQSKNAIVHSADLNYEEYEYCLSISLDEDMHLHLKRYPRSCFENNYFSDGLLSWKANTDNWRIMHTNQLHTCIFTFQRVKINVLL